MKTMEEEGLKHKISGFFLFRLDNFTDALMMDIAVAVDDAKPIESALSNTYYLEDDRMSVAKATEKACYGDINNLQPIKYERYWHGYLVTLRPLLLITDYQGIRTLNIIFLSTIFILLCTLLYHYGDKYLCYAFVFTMAVFNVWIIPFSMQFSTTFYIAFISSVFLLIIHHKQNFKHTAFLFTVTGGFTAFMDLLTTPLLTLALPLTFMVYISKEKYTCNTIRILESVFFWLAGYVMIWVSKWFIAHWMVDYAISDAFNQAVMRTSTSYGDVDMSISGIFKYISNYPSLLYAIIFLILIFLAFNLYLLKKNKNIYITNTPLLLIAIMPFLWCLLLRNHSIIHYWFVWRIFIASLLPFLLFLIKYYREKKSLPLHQ
ncbi:MAG: hypothetical protein ACI350_02875 [Prevotella sp.]